MRIVWFFTIAYALVAVLAAKHLQSISYEDGPVELLQTAIHLTTLLVCLWIIFIWKSNDQDIGKLYRLLATVLACGLILQIGREASYGKRWDFFHEYSYIFKRVVQIVVWAALAAVIWSGVRSRIWNSKVLREMLQEYYQAIALAFCSLILSQEVDKDFFYAIQPSLLSQIIEEMLEIYCYAVILIVVVCETRSRRFRGI